MQEVISNFNRNKNEENAIAMAKYMKNKFDFLGIKSPDRKNLEKDFLRKLDKKEPINKVLVLQLWSYDAREFQYLALDYLVKKKKVLTEDCMALVETLITTKPWWDTVDILASHIVGELCKNYHSLINQYILKWAVHENIWLRRTAILYQLKYKDSLDTKILEYAIMENLEDNEFFIRKAIGWVLREYSKINPQWVSEFIDNTNLSSLSVKEASKYLKDI